MAGSRADPQLSFTFTGGPADGPGHQSDNVGVLAADSPLRETTFVVVDLETTGGRARAGADGSVDAITEIGAVKVRGGEVIGEFATLVDPGRDYPAQGR